MTTVSVAFEKALRYLVLAGSFPPYGGKRNLQMPGDGRYQPDDLKPYLGYDQWAGWLVLVEWFWLKTLAEIGAMPKEDAKLLIDGLLEKMIIGITTALQDEAEKGTPDKKGTKHDILALLQLMRHYLPERLHRWLHLCATSYDIISTAYALQAVEAFRQVFLPKFRELDELWRGKIKENASIVQAGRTHLQTALPVTIGFWLTSSHNRFIRSSRKLKSYAVEIPGKFSGAVGTSASQRVLMESRESERLLMEFLGLAVAEVSTQIAPPEPMARFYHEMVLLSGALANLSEDVRILQSSQFGELISDSSSSSAMSHKLANPIAAENLAGMHTSVIAEYMKVLLTLVSDLQRDLRGSNVMRSYSAVLVYNYQQVLTAIRLLKSLEVDQKKCWENFSREGRLVVAELLHLFLQREGVPEAHHLVNTKIVPVAKTTGDHLYSVMLNYTGGGVSEETIANLRDNDYVANHLISPEKYIGDAVKIAIREAENKL